jgi:hypothetical protein
MSGQPRNSGQNLLLCVNTDEHYGPTAVIGKVSPNTVPYINAEMCDTMDKEDVSTPELFPK